MEINFFPINIDFEEFQISRTKYSDVTLKELRNKYNKSHSFFRDGDYIYISNNSNAVSYTHLRAVRQLNIYLPILLILHSSPKVVGLMLSNPIVLHSFYLYKVSFLQVNDRQKPYFCRRI